MEGTAKLKQAVREYRKGKADAFTTLYNESSKYVYTCIYKVMSGNDNAQDSINDIMQDTYVEISKYISQLEDEDKFLSWAGTIATRKCYAYLKKNNRYVLLNEDDNTFDKLSDDDNIIPEEVMQDKEKQRLVRNIIETELSEMQKLCVIAFYYNELKRSEIAKELGIPENTVKVNLARARAKIKDGVLDLEKKQGTRLYSVAPFLLLLFKEDVQAAVVPEGICQSVMSATATAAGIGATTTSATTVSATATKGMLAKIAATSIKTKIIASIVTVSVIGGGTAGVVYAVNQQEKAVVAEEETVVELETIIEQIDNTITSVEEVPANEYTEETIEAMEETVVESETTLETETEPETTEEPTTEMQVEYTYTDMSATMYATQTVNVRNLPSTDGEKIGSLSTNQEITVLGQCNETNWYKFELDGQTAFVSNSYLSTEKVEVQQSTNNNGNNNAPAGVPNPYEYSEYTWHDMGGWMFMICDKEYGNSERNHLPAVNILRERYPGAYIYYMCGQQLNDGSGRWLYLASADGTDTTVRLAMTRTYCN